MRVHISLALALALATVTSFASPAQPPAGQPPAAGGSQQPPAVTFKTGVDLVAVDVSVVDVDGRPVHDLTPEDFVLKVDGKPRRLVSAQFISQTRQLQPPVERPEGFSSNAGANAGRLIMLVIDQANIRRGSGKVVAEAAGRFIDRLSPADRVGLTVIPGAGQGVDFTANHALVKALLSRVVGRAERSVGRMHVGVADALDVIDRNNQPTLDRIVERECLGVLTPEEKSQCELQIRLEARQVLAHANFSTSESMIALRGLLGSMVGSTEPKTLVFISEGLVLQDRRAQLSWVGPLASAAHASLYVLRLEPTLFDTLDRQVSGSNANDVQLEIEGLEMLAGMARGAIFPVTSNTDFVFQRLALELSGYYLLSFEPQSSDRDGKAHRIDVGVERNKVEIRARREFTVDTGRAAMTEEDLLAETLRAHLLATEIPVKVTTYTFRDVATEKLKVMIAAEIDRAPTAADGLALAYALVDNAGKLAASEIEKDVHVAAGPAGVPGTFSTALLVDPGIYTLKFAVLDHEGHRGSVEHTFRAQVQSVGQLRIGELMLAQVTGSSASGGVQVRPVVDPVVSSDSLYAYLEMYSEATPQLEGARVALEVAADPNARTLESAEIRLQAVENGGRRAGEGSVPIAFLPPGSYVARAVVSVDGRPVARVTRPFAISRPLPPAPEVPPLPAAEGTSPRIALSRTIEPFDRSQVLAPSVVSFFLDRMYTAGSAPPSSAVRELVDDAKAGRFDTLQQQLDRVDAATAQELAPTFLRGLSLLSLGDLEGAAGRFRESLRISSDFLPAAFYLGACYAAGNRDREAVGAWQTSLVTEDDAPFVYTLLGDALLRLNDSLPAVDILREAAGLWPDNDDVRVRLATAYTMAGQGRDALATFDPYFDRHPADHARLFIAMRLLYETATSGRAIETPEQDRARFARYAKAYASAGGPQEALVEQWLSYMQGSRK
jgi:VWFA-related protein